MQQFKSGIGRPIYSLQELLRTIAQVEKTFPPLIPDGIYGSQTEAVVTQFQSEHGLPATGEVDNDTWDAIVEEYSKAIIYTLPPPTTTLFPSSRHVINIGDKADFHYPIQAAMYALSKKFDNIIDFEISDLHEGMVVDTTRQLQNIMGHDQNGKIDANNWRHISRIYENTISKDTFKLDTLRESISEENVRNEQLSDMNTNPDIIDENYVDMEEINDDIMRERERGNMSPQDRSGIFSPRLTPYNIRSEIADESTVPSEVPQTPEVVIPQLGENINVLPPNNMRRPENIILPNNVVRQPGSIIIPESGRTPSRGETSENRRIISNNTDMENRPVPEKKDIMPDNADQNVPSNRTRKEPLRWNFH